MVKKSTNHLSPLASILARQDSKLNEIVSQANKIQTLHQRLNDFLDQQFIQHVKVGNYNNNSLTLITASSAVATRLRMLVPELLNQFQVNKSLPDIRSIRIRVVPENMPLRNRNRNINSATTMSQETAQLVKNIADSIDDEEISDCLQRISAHCNR